jgi:hypothetical protein
MPKYKEYRAIWFLPSCIDNTIVGTLKLDLATGNSVLELFGNFNDQTSRFEEIILGITDEEVNITLHICHRKKWKGPVRRRDGLPAFSITAQAIYHTSYTFVGAHINHVSQLKFNSISSKITHMPEWLGINGFSNIDTDYLETHSEITYKLPKPIKFKLEKFRGEIKFIASVPSIYTYQASATISQSVRLSLTSDNSYDFNELLNELDIFKNFLVLALHTHVNINNIQLQSSTFSKEIDCYQKSEIGMEQVKVRIPDIIELFIPVRKEVIDLRNKMANEMLFVYDDIKENFAEIIYKWYEKHSILAPAFNLLSEQFNAKEKIAESSFLNLAQAIETFHARLNKNLRQIDKKEFDIIKGKIKSALLENEYKNIERLLTNYPYLDTRIQSVLDNYSTEFIDKIVGDKELFKKNLKQSRNYYTHYDPQGYRQALKGIELIHLSKKIQILLTSACLIETGISKDKLNIWLEEKGYKMFGIKSENI